MTGIDILDSDEKIRELNKEISEMYEGYYEFVMICLVTSTRKK